ncbi:MAG: efflux RND transporter periplasmic adaptor subunit [Planctomycetota bacterium]|nr:efflux RND transporter periplasmic adaptor subunit [Planctomycetota bacterium]MDA0917958.1 efflux RND transporter periplasmic adaptor subunit [Planctomycetota bacterium]
MRKRDRLICFAALFAATGFSISLSGCNQAEPSARVENTVDNTPTVRLVAAERTTIERTTTQPATIHAYHQAEIHAKVAGYLSELNVDIGQTVEKGDVLGVISVPEMQISFERKQAEIRSLEAEQESAAAGVKLAQADVDAAVAQQAQATAEVAKMDAQVNADTSEFNRVTQLVEQKAVAGRLLDEARQKLEASTSAKAAVQAALQSAVAAVTVAREKAAVAEAGVKAAAAQTDVIRKELEELATLMQYAILKAPFRGVVTQRHVDPGDLVRNIQDASESSREPLFEIAQVDRVRLRVAIPETEAPLVRVGNAVALKLRSLPNREFEGTISRIARRLDESTRTMLIEVDLDNTDGLLIPGMYGEATVALQQTPDALVIAATAVRFDETGNSSVYVFENGAIRTVPVVTGHDNGRQIQILSGIDETAKIAAGRIGRFKDGQKVSVEGS